jgi:hypothetical protein
MGMNYYLKYVGEEKKEECEKKVHIGKSGGCEFIWDMELLSLLKDPIVDDYLNKVRTGTHNSFEKSPIDEETVCELLFLCDYIILNEDDEEVSIDEFWNMYWKSAGKENVLSSKDLWDFKVGHLLFCSYSNFF